VRARCKECDHKYYELVRDRVSVTSAEYRAQNRDSLAIKQRQFRADHAEIISARSITYRSRNPNKMRDWHKRNPNANRAYLAKRRALILGSSDTHTADDIQEILRLQKQRCACCRCQLQKYDVDHITPLSKGGSNGRANIQILCPVCNRQKNAKDPINFMQLKGYLL
jgi:5-methylcytosine-specific restriction endonuclease McrA